MPQGQRALRALLAVSCPPAAGLGAIPIPPQTADGSTRRTPSATDWGTHLFPRNSFLIRLAEAELTVGCFSTHLGFCSFHSHCDSVFQQSDQLSGTVSALVPSPKRAASFPMWVRVFPCGCEFSTCTCLRHDEISSPQETWVRVFPCGCEFSNLHFPDKMEISSPQETWGAHFPMWVRVSNLHPTRAENIPQILLGRL